MTGPDRRISDRVPAIALTVLREHYADELATRDADAARGIAEARKQGEEATGVREFFRRAAASQRDALTAQAAADQAAARERQRIAEWLSAQARRTSRNWAGAYRNIARELTETKA
jgi:hypothetical protein